MTDYDGLIREYAAGAEQLSCAIEGMADEQLNATPIPGKWSTRQVVCHLADFELVYADRLKRVIAENEPTFFGGDPDLFAARLAYDRRVVAEELQLIQTVRVHVVRLLRSLRAADFERTGQHSEAGWMTLATLLQQITSHIPHHVQFIEEKRQALLR